MSYSDFKTIGSAIDEFSLTVIDRAHLFSGLDPIQPSARLRETLAETLDLASSISTEKARSELILSPIFLEVRRILNNQIGYFSGTTFNVDESRGLTGVCDFILSASPNQLLITAPVITVVEAKDNDLRLGLGQCVAEMVAAQLFNERRGQVGAVYGVVTTGIIWQFMSLFKQSLKVDRTEYLINELPLILGNLVSPFRS